jgi:Fe-S-cluster-containing dehydrogenase component
LAIDRRDFLLQGLLAAGAAALGAAAGRASAGMQGTSSPSSAGGAASLPATTPALTADGRVVSLPVAPGAATANGGMLIPKAAEPTGRQGVPGRKWIMVIDLARCDGCGHCTLACNAMHWMPPGRQYIPVLVMRDAKSEAPYYFPRPCYHCDEPPCTKVCPVNATYKTQDGTVLIDNNRCIGCRFCMAACPYGARSFNWGHPPQSPAQQADYSPEWGFPRKIGTVEKCDFCPEHAAMGVLPACALNCPMGVLYFGDENEDAVTNSAGETVRLSAFLRDRAAYRELESLGTHPRVYYLPPVHRQYPAPGEAKEKGT